MEQQTLCEDAFALAPMTRAVAAAPRPAPEPARGPRMAARRLRMAVHVLTAALALVPASHAAGEHGASDDEPALLQLAVPFMVTGPIDIRGADRSTRVYRVLSPHAPQPISDVAAEIVRSALAAPGTRVVVVRRSSAHNRLDCSHGPDEAAPGAGLVLVNHEAIAARCQANGLPAAVTSQRQLVAPIAIMPIALVISTRFAIPDLARLPAGSARTKQLAIGSPGAYSAGRVAGELLQQSLGVRLLVVGYNGGHAALNALLAGEIDLFFAALPLALPYIQAGRVPAIGVASSERFALLPDLPTLTELGYPGLTWEGWFALYSAGGLDEGGRARLAGRLSGALAARALRSTLLARGLQPADPDPIRFAARVAAERAQAARLLASSE